MKLHTYLCTLVVLSCAAIATASEFDGTWKGIVQRRSGETFETVYHLKVEGQTLTGTIDTPRGTIDIEDGKVDGDEITFNTSRGDNKIPHNGKLADGKLTISVETPGGKREYTLTRADATEKAPADKAPSAAAADDKLSGRWIGNFKTPDGNDIELTFDFKVDGGNVTGTVDGPGGQLPVENGKLEGDDFSFDTTVGDNVIGHKGKVGGDEITLKCNGFDTEWDLVIKRDAGK